MNWQELLDMIRQPVAADGRAGTTGGIRASFANEPSMDKSGGGSPSAGFAPFADDMGSTGYGLEAEAEKSLKHSAADQARPVQNEGTEGTYAEGAKALLDVVGPAVLHLLHTDSPVQLLNRQGARLLYMGGVLTIAIWAASDMPEVRAAIAALHPGGIQVMHLEDARVPDRYREGKPEHLKTVADRTPPEARGRSWAEWEARMLNELFAEQGTGGAPGRITPETVRHGETNRRC